MAGVFVHPSELRASELRAVLALHKHGQPAPVSAGHCFAAKMAIRWDAFLHLIDLGLAYWVGRGERVDLTPAGRGMARGLEHRRIVGYD
jgi:hypothetical protein